jgi:hypothetical protein
MIGKQSTTVSAGFLNQLSNNWPNSTYRAGLMLVEMWQHSCSLRAQRIDMRDQKSTPDGKAPNNLSNQDFVLPEWPTLPDFAFDSAAHDGVEVDSLAPGTRVRIQTQNSEYWLTVLEGGHRRVLVQGGILPTASEARVEGATDGGTALHRGWIEVDRSLEMVCGPRRITTSRVREISFEKPASPTHHHAA